MIVTDREVLKKISRETSPSECQEIRIFERLEKALLASPREGVGLAAIQIGEPIRACIIRYTKSATEQDHYPVELHLNMINPVILERSREIIGVEGCLSLPGVSVNVERAQQITCRWMNEDLSIQDAVFYGLEAVIIQHELAHFEGRTILDDQIRKVEKQGRNEPCHCGSGKKFKKCCGR
jgi:peptide deformylase